MKQPIKTHTTKSQAKADSIYRRRFLKSLGQIMGYTTLAALSAGNGMATALEYTAKPKSETANGLIFTQAQMLSLASICQCVIPATDTLGAADVDCHGFVDNQLMHCHSKQEQSFCVRSVKLIEQLAQGKFRQDFSSLKASQQTQILISIEDLSLATVEQKSKFIFLKSLIVFGYFTSKEGASELLNFVRFPGGFKGSIQVDKNTRNQGLLAFY